MLDYHRQGASSQYGVGVGSQVKKMGAEVGQFVGGSCEGMKTRSLWMY